MNGANSNDFPISPQRRPVPPPTPYYPQHRPAEGPAALPAKPPAVHPPAAPPGRSASPLPPRPASIVPTRGFKLPPAGKGRRWSLSGLTELVLALPWLWWSWYSIMFLGTFSETLTVIQLVLWIGVALGSLLPQGEAALAWKVWRLRPPNEIEKQRIGPAWFAVCSAAGVDPDRYRVWIHEGPEVTAPAVAGSTVAVTSWSAWSLPPRNLEAVLAHELAHRLALPRPVSLLAYALSLPARVMGAVIRSGWHQPVVGFILKVILALMLIGIFGLYVFWGFNGYIALLLSPVLAPFVVPLAARASEKYADRIALDLGYGPALTEVFYHREYQRAQQWQTAPRQGLKDSRPLDSARLRALERVLSSAPQNGHQPLY
ncbi:MAG TPA: M48 family metalloprotease [Kribbella sp.]|nr:M48 family metalloprotease [Kribbella sp.]